MSDDLDITDLVGEVHYDVESKHQIHETWCTCGFQSYVSRDRTKHIVTATLRSLGVEEPTS